MTQQEFADALQSFRTTEELSDSRQRPLKMEDIRRRQCKVGELCWLATVSRPDICVRLAQLASKVNSLRGSDTYQGNDLIETAKDRKQATVLEYQSGPHLCTLTLARWSDAAYGNGTLTLARWSDPKISVAV